MMWQVNGYCPKGHIATLKIGVDEFGQVRVHVPEKCLTCVELEAPRPPGVLKRWLARRRFRRQLRKL